MSLNTDGEQVGEIAEYKQKIAKAKMTGVALGKGTKRIAASGKNDATKR